MNNNDILNKYNDILNKYIDLIDKGYCCACNELNCIDNFPQAKITHAIRKLQQENKQLQERIEYLERSNNRREDTILEQRQEIGDLEDNWNKLKEIIKKKFVAQGGFTSYEWNDLLNELLDKMAELEQGNLIEK